MKNSVRIEIKEERLGAKITMQLLDNGRVTAQRKRYVPCEMGSRAPDMILLEMLTGECVDAVRLWLNQMVMFKDL